MLMLMLLLYKMVDSLWKCAQELLTSFLHNLSVVDQNVRLDALRVAFKGAKVFFVVVLCFGKDSRSSGGGFFVVLKSDPLLCGHLLFKTFKEVHQSIDHLINFLCE